MQFTVLIGLALMADSVAICQTMEARGTIFVCWDKGAAEVGAIDRAQLLGSVLFREIGVTVKWHRVLRDCPTEGIVVTLRSKTPASLKAGALGSSLVYEGSHVQVFYDRIAKQWDREPVMISNVLAHVVVHEVAHILEGIDRHSGAGVMKARWDEQDFFDMRRNRFGFAHEDVVFIYRGLATPTARVMLAGNANSPAVLMQ